MNDFLGAEFLGAEFPTTEAAAVLARPLVLARGRPLPNRIVKSATSERLADPGGAPSERLVALYRRWAAGGTGLLITGNVMVDPAALGEADNVVVEDERHLGALARWAEETQRAGARIWMQINHPGRQSPRRLSPRPVAPSAVGMRRFAGVFATPRALDDDEVSAIIARFGRTAEVARRAGFDGVQVHAAHGYLASQFLSPLTNRRDDRWGGSLGNRMRFLLEVVRAVRAAAGEALPVGVKLNSADFQRGGFGEDDSLEVARVLADEGVDLLEVSGGTYSSAAMLGVDPSLKESTRRREAYFVDFAERVRREVPDLPLMLTGGFRTLGAMSEAVASGAVDVVGLGRPLTVEPHAPAGLLDGSVTSSQVRPRRSGIRTLDNLTELVHYSVQMWRMADGRDPAPDRHPALNVAQYLARNGRDSIRSTRRGL